MSIGKYSYGNIEYNNTNLEIKMGNFCSIGSNVKAYSKKLNKKNHISHYSFGSMYTEVFNNYNNIENNPEKETIIIENDVWIADNSVIMSGVTIGNGAVVANKSHVIDDVKPYSIVGGNPAKLIRYRFSEKQIEDLLKIKWWNWDENKINENMNLICNNNIDEFINKNITIL